MGHLGLGGWEVTEYSHEEQHCTVRAYLDSSETLTVTSA